jgi:hypothetical protein
MSLRPSLDMQVDMALSLAATAHILGLVRAFIHRVSVRHVALILFLRTSSLHLFSHVSRVNMDMLDPVRPAFMQL